MTESKSKNNDIIEFELLDAIAKELALLTASCTRIATELQKMNEQGLTVANQR